MNVERQLTSFCLVAERTRDHIHQVREEYLFRIYGHGARLDLRQIQNVADEIQKIGTGAVDGSGKLDLFAGEIAFRIFRQLLAQD